ncbi:ATP-binding protein [Hyalangium rubrum]|uniref:histidine kinase n=1 Tax=Hyalangium rubrum TaxID=3103134 RepID=A0ABU5H1F2_9BACT|nr:ATP-binding protein [Hyalangium sp. s54d21]MDY7227286.1 ATP-binding protein [Hyalangium sp. s54d21]
MPIRSSITIKLIGYLLAVSVAPLLVFGVVTYDVARGTIVSLASDYNARLLDNQRDYLLLQSEQVASLATNIAGVEDISTALAAAEAGDSYSALATQARVGYILSGYSSLKGLVSIDLFTPQGRHFHVGDTLDTSAVQTELWERLYRDTLASPRSIVWHGVEDNVNATSDHRKVLVATRLLRRVVPEQPEPEPVGIVVINSSTDSLHEHFRRLDVGADGYLMVTDSQGRLLFHPDKQLIGQPLLPEFRALLSGEKGTVALQLGGEDVLLNHLRVAEMNWHVISVLPQASLTAPMSRIGGTGLVVLLACFVVIGLVAVRYSRRVVGPIRAISEGFRHIQQDRLEDVHPLPPSASQDEIGKMVAWFNASLENLNARRRSEEELRQAKESAEQANRSKSEFLANMSHEIRTPMNAILGMTQLALEAESLAQRRDFIFKASRSAQSLLGILNDILDFSKIEAGRLELERVPVSLEELFSELSDTFSSTAQDKGLALRFEGAPCLPTELRGDPLRLRQVLQNLIGNALKFTSAGEVVVRVEKLSEEAHGVGCRFSVRDTGIGITAQQLPRLFQSFFQADSSVTRKYGGTGLGLAISKRLVELMGGQIGVDSEYGQGSCFWFQLPLAKALPGEERAEPRVPPAHLRGARLLLVEDNRLNQEVAIHFLRRAGVGVDVATQGAEALERLARGAYDAVLMDCHMPLMDGYEATRRIRAMPGLSELPIIAMTANALEGDRERSLAAGMNDHLSKPIDAQKLYQTLGRWLAQRSRQEASPRVPSDVGDSRKLEQPDPRHVNMEGALLNLDGDVGLYRKVAELFLGEAPNYLEQLRVASTRGDSEAAIRAVHNLKSLAASVGAHSLRDHARALESAAKAAEAPGLVGVSPAFEQELARVLATLQGFLGARSE